MKEDKTFIAEVSAILARYRKTQAPSAPVVLLGASNLSRWDNAYEALAPYICLNHAIAGVTDVELIRWSNRLAGQFKPGVIILNSSQNDITCYNNEEISENRIKLLRKLKLENPCAVIFVMSVIRAPGFQDSRIDAIDMLHEDICRSEGVSFVDLRYLFDGSCFSDSSHLSPEGYDRLAGVLKEKLAQLKGRQEKEDDI